MIILEEFNGGMENWAAVTLDAQFVVIGATPAMRFNLVAHELTHMWIGNMVTISNWRLLCLQVGSSS
jgi:aminopeptidase N